MTQFKEKTPSKSFVIFTLKKQIKSDRQILKLFKEC